MTQVRNWEFSPARVGRLAVESEIEVPVRFRLLKLFGHVASRNIWIALRGQFVSTERQGTVQKRRSTLMDNNELNYGLGSRAVMLITTLQLRSLATISQDGHCYLSYLKCFASLLIIP